jgi:hypothetical protein
MMYTPQNKVHALGLLTSKIGHRFERPGKALDAPVPTPAAKTESTATAKTEGVDPPTSGEAIPARSAHCEDSVDKRGRARRR